MWFYCLRRLTFLLRQESKQRRRPKGGATRLPPVARGRRGASGRGRQDASLLCQAKRLPGTATGCCVSSHPLWNPPASPTESFCALPLYLQRPKLVIFCLRRFPCSIDRRAWGIVKGNGIASGSSRRPLDSVLWVLSCRNKNVPPRGECAKSHPGGESHRGVWLVFTHIVVVVA